MALDTSNILKEMSALSSNMDSLVRELKEQTKNTAENTKSINDLVGEIKGEIKQKPTNLPDQKTDQTKLFQNLISSFSKEISRSNEMLQKTLGKELGSSLGDLTKNILKPAEVKPNFPNLDLAKILGLDKLPKLKDGGQIQKDGMAIVGEEGPEIVKLKKDQKVISKQDELYKSALEEMEEDRKRRANPEIQDLSMVSPQQRLVDIKKTKQKEIDTAKSQINEILSGKNSNSLQDLVTQMPTLEGFIENKSGVKVPKAAIKKEREDLLSSDLNYYTKYPEDLQEELDYFIESYEEAPKPAENQPISVLSSLTQKEQGQKIPGLTDGTKPKTDSESKSKKENKKNQESVISPTKPSLLDSLKAKGKDIGSKLKKDFTTKADDFKQGLKQTLSGQINPSELETTGSMAKSMQKLAEDMKASQIKKETPTLKKTEEPKNSSKISTTPSPLSEESSTRSSETPSITSKTPETKKQSKKENDETLPPEDIKEIKSLLAGIYKLLSGPLRISNDTPFRPNSNVI